MGPPFLQASFRAAGLHYRVATELNLNSSLRSQAASELHRWVELVLDHGSLGEAARLATRLRHAAFPIYVTRDLDAARDYARSRFGGEPQRRFGLLASSKAKNLQDYDVDPGFQATKLLRTGCC